MADGNAEQNAAHRHRVRVEAARVRDEHQELVRARMRLLSQQLRDGTCRNRVESTLELDSLWEECRSWGV